MTKRRLDDGGFANVLRQKHKEDPILKQQAAQNTFALLMRAQKPQQKPVEPSYEYFNMNNTQLPVCYKCTKLRIQDKCTFCEHALCQDCLQQCTSCQQLYCSTCSVIDYSMPIDQVFCLNCKQ